MIKSISIENFKSIGPMARIPLKPITLIFGPNSSGKSSIIQSLLMLKETLSNGQSGALQGKGESYDVGGYHDFVHNHDIERQLAFKFELRDFVGSTWNLEGDDYSEPDGWKQLVADLETILDGRSAFVTIRFSYNKNSRQSAVSSFKLHVGESYKPVVTYIRDREDSNIFSVSPDCDHPFFWEKFATVFANFVSDFLHPSTTITDENIFELYLNDISCTGILPESMLCLSAEKNGKNIYKSKADINNFGFDYYYHEKLNTDCFQDPAFLLSQASGEIKNFIENIEHIEPLRKEPRRYYSVTDDADLIKTYTGACPSIFDYLSDNDNLDEVNASLSKIGINYRLELKFSDEFQDICAINLVNTLTGVTSSLKDVGVGISQVLPIVVASLSAKNKTFAIEQPELHLHPAAQTELGDLFIRSALNGANNRFVIETHSEHLILRLLRRLRETADGDLPEGVTPVTPDDIAVLYVSPGEDGADILNLPVNEEGEFDCPWPNGFFNERMKELY
jgi:hypothetical protein